MTLDEISDVEAQLAVIDSLLIQSDLAVDAARISLEKLIRLQVPSFCPLPVLQEALERPDREIGFEALLDMASNNASGLQAAELSVEKHELVTRSAKRFSSPRVEGFAALSYSNDSFQDAWRWRDSVGLQITIPIVSGGAKNASIGRAAAQLRKAELEHQIAVADLREAVRMALRLYHDRRAEAEVRARSVASKQEQLGYVDEALQGGYRKLSRLVEVRSQLTGMTRQRLQTDIDYLQTIFELDILALSGVDMESYLLE